MFFIKLPSYLSLLLFSKLTQLLINSVQMKTTFCSILMSLCVPYCLNVFNIIYLKLSSRAVSQIVYLSSILSTCVPYCLPVSHIVYLCPILTTCVPYCLPVSHIDYLCPSILCSILQSPGLLLARMSNLSADIGQ